MLGLWALLLVVVVSLAHELRADLTRRPVFAVHIHVRRAGADRPHELVELTRGEALRRRAPTDIGSPDGAGNGAARFGARLRSRRAVAEVRAEEHDDRAVVRRVLEVDVRLLGGRLESAERQRVLDLGGVLVDGCLE